MNDEQWMQRAFELALKAQARGEVPIGAVVVIDDELIAEGFNQTITQNDPTAHAEIIAIRKACQSIGNYRLPQATLYTTLEPCCMCAGTLVHARIKRIVFATTDPKAGAAGSVFNLLKGFPLNHQVKTQTGVMQEECSQLLKTFFKKKR